MSLKYVTRKLEDQSLEEEAAAITSAQEAAAEEAEDSGTESDDETEKEDVEGESEGGDGALDSGVSLNLRSSSQTARHAGSRQLPSLVPEPPQTPTPLSTSQPASLPSTLPSSLPLDLDDNHSSEEELEDIIGTKKVYTSTTPAGTSTSIKTCTSTNPEKRKWSEVTSSSDEAAATGRASTCVFRAGSGSSGDEEVCGLMEGADGGSYTPVQFCTSPPLDVYKPRKSQSPPPKLFHMSTNGCGHLGVREAGLPRQGSLDSATRHREGPGRPSGAFRPRPRSGRPGVVELCSLPSEGVVEGEVGEEAEEASGHRSPNKRHRTTPRPHNIQRPCLDFEKMQQIKTRVVTSWRQGTELSLFCW